MIQESYQDALETALEEHVSARPSPHGRGERGGNAWVSKNLLTFTPPARGAGGPSCDKLCPNR